MSASRPTIEELPRAASGPEEATAAEIAWKGIELCRREDWQEGLYQLSRAAGARVGLGELPALYYSYLGYGVARFQKQKEQGLELCLRAVELEFYQPECYVFLARTYLLMGDRRAAYSVVERGLQVDSSHQGMLALRLELGERRPPVLSFLPRQHLLNRWLGLARHRMLRSGTEGSRSAESSRQ